MSKICRGCGGVVGRDCFNPIECEQISASMNNDQHQEIQYLRNENKKLQQELSKKDNEIIMLMGKLKNIASCCLATNSGKEDNGMDTVIADIYKQSKYK